MHRYRLPQTRASTEATDTVVYRIVYYLSSLQKREIPTSIYVSEWANIEK